VVTYSWFAGITTVLLLQVPCTNMYHFVLYEDVWVNIFIQKVFMSCNKGMGRVDQVDTDQEWVKKMVVTSFSYILDVSVVSAWLLYHKLNTYR
jgi:hypothetical protein